MDPVTVQYDDYNWDWSLQYISLNCLKEKLQVMLIKGPRVFHIGEWSVWLGEIAARTGQTAFLAVDNEKDMDWQILISDL